MDACSTPFHFVGDRKREPVPIVFWNGGRPVLIDATGRWVKFVELGEIPVSARETLRAGVMKLKIRCVGFERDCRRARASSNVRGTTWAVE